MHRRISATEAFFPSAIFCCKLAAPTHADFMPKDCTKLIIYQPNSHKSQIINFNIAQAWLSTFSDPNKVDPGQESKKNRKCSKEILNICLKCHTKTFKKTSQNPDHETNKILGICTRNFETTSCNPRRGFLSYCQFLGSATFKSFPQLIQHINSYAHSIKAHGFINPKTNRSLNPFSYHNLDKVLDLSKREKHATKENMKPESLRASFVSSGPQNNRALKPSNPLTNQNQ